MSVKHDFMWGVLVHLGTNMWYEPWDKGHEAFTQLWEIPGSYKMRLDKNVWDEYMVYLKECGVNTIVLDLGDGMIYDSHPEIAIEGSWTKTEMRVELKKLNEMGFEVVPKLNFSSCHDAWMKEYSRMLSTSVYYKFCEDIINEVCELFKPRFFHIGFDEETYDVQKHYSYVVVRQGRLWWNDLYKLVDMVEKNGARVMMWSDYMCDHPEEYLEKCPKSVIPCNWYYDDIFDFNGEEIDSEIKMRLRPFELLEKHGFDQIPGGSSYYRDDNITNLVKYCKEKISKEHLLGFIQTSWASVTEKEREKVFKSGTLLSKAINK